ncbi:MAG: hypothetical protein ACRD0W_22250, partial [Acidimicrobiales bacterium]
TEDDRIRAAADALLADLEFAEIKTVANTIFPSALAATCATPETLCERYRAMYPTLQKLDKGNRFGIYFGRVVAYPGVDGDHDQLAATIAKLRTERASRGPKSARYEIGISDPVQTDVHIYVPGVDTSPMGFPCLSFCSLQLDGDRLHMVAHYRYQYLVLKGYGNYLGLAQLLAYIAGQADLTTGNLTVVTGRAYVDVTKARVASLEPLLGADRAAATVRHPTE